MPQKLVSMRDSAGVQAACMQLAPQMQQAVLALRALAALGVASRTEDATGALRLQMSAKCVLGPKSAWLEGRKLPWGQGWAREMAWIT